MAPRRTHRKSRNGCVQCKQRREMVPCGHCKARQLSCQYSRPAGNQLHGLPIGQDTPGSVHAGTDSDSGQISMDRHLQELSLMHRWSVTTYDTIPTKFPDDYNIWQAEMPEVALQHPFLLDTLLAITTFELSGPPESAAEDYVKAGFLLKDRAVKQIPPLSAITDTDTNAALLYLSPLHVLITLASIQYQPAGVPMQEILQQLTSDLTVLQKLQTHLQTHSTNLAGHTLLQSSIAPSEVPSQPLDQLTATIFRRLDELNKSRTGPPASAPFEVRFQATLHQSSCKKAIFWLEEAYTNLPLSSVNHDNIGHFHDHGLGWIYLIDGEFISALREADEVANLLFLVWALLIQTRGNRFWWARRLGTRMLATISSSFANSTSTTMRELFEWANGQALAI